jgi:SAM-dependent methyltransferase
VTSTTVSHPVFARCFKRLSWLLERDAAAHRRRMVARASGRVVEIGAGNGINFRHYPTTVEEVVALEPESYLGARAQSAARDAPVPVSVAHGVADELPLEDRCCDTAVASLVLCSVPDPPGCHRARDAVAAIKAAGFHIERLEHVTVGPAWGVTNPYVVGIAT